MATVKAQPAKAGATATFSDDDEQDSVTEPTPEELAAYREYVRNNASPQAQALVAQGAAPVNADTQTLIEQMQAQIASLMSERGVPADPVEAASKNLWEHVNARSNAMPHVEFKELKDELSKDNPDPEVINLLVADLPQHPELAYLAQLARDHHKAVLKAGK